MTHRNKGMQTAASDEIQHPIPQRPSLMRKIAARVPSFSRHVSPQPGLTPSPGPSTNHWGRRISQILDYGDALGDTASIPVPAVIIPSALGTMNNLSDGSDDMCPNDPNTLFSYPDFEPTDRFCGICRGPSPATEGTAFRKAASLVHSYGRTARSRRSSPSYHLNTDLQAIRDATCAPGTSISRNTPTSVHRNSTTSVPRSRASFPRQLNQNTDGLHTPSNRPPTRRRTSLSTPENERAYTPSTPDGQDWSQTVFYPSYPSPPSSSRPRTSTVPSTPLTPSRPSSALASVPENRQPKAYPPSHLDITFGNHPLAPLLYAGTLPPGAIEQIRITSGTVNLDSVGRPVNASLNLNINDFHHRRRRRRHQEELRRFLNGSDGDGESELSYLPSDFSSYGPSESEGDRVIPRLRGGGCTWSDCRLLGHNEDENDAETRVDLLAESCTYLTIRALLICNTFDPASSSAEDDIQPPRIDHVHQLERNTIAEKSCNKIITLRGGGPWLQTKKKPKVKEPLSQLNEDDHLPAGLYWLAGGTGTPVNVRQWNNMKPKKRMGGLLGMLVFGKNAGMPYEKRGGLRVGEQDVAEPEEAGNTPVVPEDPADSEIPVAQDAPAPDLEVTGAGAVEPSNADGDGAGGAGRSM